MILFSRPAFRAALVVLALYSVHGAAVVRGQALAPTMDPVQAGALPALAPVEAWLDGCFATAQMCALCHSSAPGALAMRDSAGQSVAPFDLWQSSMMANSARDPLWRAMVSVEVARHPDQRQMIEAKCLKCHSPMASVEKQHAGSVLALSELYDPESRFNQLALDGVSCTMCHQIEPEGLGEEQSFSGGYTIASQSRIYGPHKNPMGMPMIRHSGFEPIYGEHITESELCATCHTLETYAILEPASEGETTLSTTPFLEQSPYLEWRNSVFGQPGPERATCQQCHVPRTGLDGHVLQTRIARNPMGGDFGIEERQPFGRHVFVGGNTMIPAILRDNAARLGVTAPPAAFDATIAAVRDQLQHRTAVLKLSSTGVKDGTLRFDVSIENLCGHKLPSAHPVRRVWLRAVVRDQEGAVLFGSGSYGESGQIVGADGTPLASECLDGPFQPHYRTIRSADQVQIYESVMGDVAGKLTFGLLDADHYLKDNRLLPRGWRADHADGPRTAPVGTKEDSDFLAGSDRVRYEVSLPTGVSKVQVEVTLFHQVLGGRFAREILKWDTPEMRDFRGYYEAADRGPELIASETLELPVKGSQGL